LRRLLQLRTRTIRCNRFYIAPLHKTITLCNFSYDTDKVVLVFTRSHIWVRSTGQSTYKLGPRWKTVFSVWTWSLYPKRKDKNFLLVPEIEP